MHTIYDVVETSVKQSALCNSKTLRVKLTVTPLISSCNKKSKSFQDFYKFLFGIWLKTYWSGGTLNLLLERDMGILQSKQEHLEENHPVHIRSARYLKCELKPKEYPLNAYFKPFGFGFISHMVQLGGTAGTIPTSQPWQQELTCFADFSQHLMYHVW